MVALHPSFWWDVADGIEVRNKWDKDALFAVECRARQEDYRNRMAAAEPPVCAATEREKVAEAQSRTTAVALAGASRIGVDDADKNPRDLPSRSVTARAAHSRRDAQPKFAASATVGLPGMVGVEKASPGSEAMSPRETPGDPTEQDSGATASQSLVSVEQTALFEGEAA